jgi:hypothetical protein
MALPKDRHSKQHRARVSELRMGPALVPPQTNRTLDSGVEVIARAARRKKRTR